MKSRKGQVSIEFMLLLLIMLVYIQTVIEPMIEVSTNTALDTTRLGQARFAAEKLVDTIDYIGLLPVESKQTITLFVPLNSKISCVNTNQKIRFEYELQGTDDLPVACELDDDSDLGRCTRDLTVNSQMRCGTGFSLDLLSETAVSGTAFRVSVENTDAGVVVNEV